MAELVGIFAASHTPVMLNFPDAIPDADRETIFASFQSLGDALRRTEPDTVVVISDDHVHNFFLDNFPAFCIGAAASYATPVEHWLKADRQVLAGDGELGAHLLGEALRGGFDPSFSMELTLDHGVLTPLHLAGLAGATRLVPLLINCVQPPLPTMARCLQWGRLLREAIASFAGPAGRVAILATGGISHDIATPRMGAVNEGFDREFLRLLQAGDEAALVRYATDHVNEAGNGAEEIRTWLVAHGAAGGGRFEPLFYKAVANWYTGIGLGRWHVGNRE
ncbi:2,3-dihydroxyphenylpropionate 1,2-dioxygenase [Ramlibacter sp. AW1]|uniref:2,3-dihydroxyphenylpropionate 1,2-dioxygenase n=1 Tax=Ramlibacter aurantiacus TaxID=2801330 RepID=A0A936ZL51_9BURK|nr:2,3-dihydroxyphenylpropionate 1,2-dioxygenase [Ramlibacter aurantiacus]